MHAALVMKTIFFVGEVFALNVGEIFRDPFSLIKMI